MVALLGAIVAAAAAGEYPCVGPEPCPGYPFPPRCAAPCPAHCLLLCFLAHALCPDRLGRRPAGQRPGDLATALAAVLSPTLTELGVSVNCTGRWVSR
jgi:hypothetical protein